MPYHLFFGVAALTVHQMMRHPASSSADDDDPGCLPGTAPSTTHPWLRAVFRTQPVAMQIGMRQISSETVAWFGLACGGSGLTRTALARGLCEREYGRSPRPDGRVRRRIAAMGAAWTRRLGEPLRAIFPGEPGFQAPGGAGLGR